MPCLRVCVHGQRLAFPRLCSTLPAAPGHWVCLRKSGPLALLVCALALGSGLGQPPAPGASPPQVSMEEGELGNLCASQAPPLQADGPPGASDHRLAMEHSCALPWPHVSHHPHLPGLTSWPSTDPWPMSPTWSKLLSALASLVKE